MKKVISIAIALILILVLINSNITKVIGMVEDSGYVLLDNNIVDNLNKEELETTDMTIQPYKVESNETIYEKNGGIYIGEDRVKINEKFPIFTNNGNAINIITNSGVLLTDNFTPYEVFPNIFISDGALYQSSTRVRLDSNNYILYQMENELYTSLSVVEIITKNKKYDFQLNSIIKFNESNVRAYNLNGNVLSYRSADNLDSSTRIRIGDKEYNYLEFIKKINNEKEGSKKEDKELEEGKEELGKTSKEEANNKNPNLANKENESTDNNLGGDNADGNNILGGNNSNNKEEDLNYKEPSIILVDIDRGVYSLTPNFNIQDIDKNISYPIDIKVYQGEKLVLRKSIKEGESDYKISGLKPDSKYYLSINYNYLNSKGEKVSKEIKSSEVKTKDISELKEMEIYFEEGDIYNNSIQLKNISISFEDDLSKEALEKINLVDNGKVLSSFSKEQLLELKNGSILEKFNSSNDLTSNKEWNFKLIAYDRYENELPIRGNEVNGRTSKLPPIATLKNKGNDFTSYEIGYSLENTDNVEILNNRYEVVLEGTDIVISEALNSDTINIEGLEFNTEYFLRVYGDYDLNDNNGLINDNLMGELKIKTPPLNSVGAVNINTEFSEISSDSFKLSLNINKKTTNENLIKYIDNAILKIKGSNDIEIELSEDEKNKLKNGEVLDFNFDKLKSNSRYDVSLELYNIDRNQKSNLIKTVISKGRIETHKKDSDIYIYDILTTEKDAILSVYVKDEDKAIQGGLVDFKVIDKNGRNIYSTVIGVNEEFKDIKVINLKADEVYDVKLTAAYYNITNDKDTVEKSKVLETFQLKAEKSLEGNLKLNVLSEHQDGSIELDFNAYIRDNYKVLEDNKFYINKYRKNNNEYVLEQTYEYETVENLEDNNRIFNDKITVNVPKGKYKFTIVGNVYGKEMELEEPLEFTVSRSSKVISSIEEINKINEDASYNYLIVKDLNFSKSEFKIVEEVTGIVDFDGHNVTLDIRQNTYNALFSRIGSTGEIKNIKLNLRNYDTGYDGKYGLAEFSYGKISDIQVTFSGNGTNESYNTSAILRENYGVVENFIVKVNSNITTTDSFGLVAINNYALIKNGYIYGDGTIQVDNNSKSNRVIGGAVGTNSVSGKIEGVYSYVAVNGPERTKSTYIGNVIGKNLGEAINIYSDKIGEGLIANYGPTVGYNNGKVINSYYYLNPDNSSKNTNNSFNKIAEAVSLRNEEFIKSIYDENVFNIDFSGETLYYPTLRSTEDMIFDQPLIEIPKDESLNRLSLISTTIQNKTNTSAELKLNINNLNGQITEINIPDTNIIEVKQETKGNLTTVIAKVEPEKNFENYNLQSIKYQQGGSIKTLNFGANEVILPFDFYKPIMSVEDWDNYMISKDEVNGKVIENYSIEVDLDFNQSAPTKTNVVIGKLKGNGKAITNLKLDFNNDDTALIYKVDGTIEGLNFKDIDINITADRRRIGLIYWNLGEIKNVSFDNININKENLINRNISKDEMLNDTLRNNWSNYINDANGDIVATIVYNDKLIEDVMIKNSTIVGKSNVGALVGVNSSYISNTDGGVNIPRNREVYPNATLNNIISENNIVISTINQNNAYNYMGGLVGTNRAKLKKNTVNNNIVLSRGPRVGGIIGNNVGENIDVGELYIANSSVYSVSSYVGGIVSYSNQCSFLRVGAMNTDVVGFENIGGIVGTSETLILEKAFVNGGSVRGRTRVGGIIGTNGVPSKGDIIKDVYSVTDIHGGLQNASGNQGVGALVGYLMNGSSIVEDAFVGGTVNSKGTNEFVGAIGVTQRNTVMKNVLNYATYTVASNKYSYSSGNKNGKMENILIWEGSSFNGNKFGNTAKGSVITEELKTKEFYIDKLKLNVENWSFNGLPQYMPKLIYNGGIIPNQPDLNIPVDEEVSLSIEKNKIPSVNIYTVSADSINLEFSKVNKEIDFEIFIGDESVLRQPIIKNIFTLQYDFVSPLRIELKKGNEVINTSYVVPELISRKVLLQDDKYYYITSEGIKTNDKVISGDFVNIYKGLALTRSGDLIDVKTGEIVSSGIKGVKSLERIKPLFRFKL